jgi:hypothetical protein
MRHFGARRTWLLGSLLAGLFFYAGCAAVQQQAVEMLTLAQCQFRLASVADTTLAGMPLQGGSNLSALNLLKVQSAFTSGTLPLEFTVNVQAKNPNASVASMSGMEWIVLMDGVQMTTGVLQKAVAIPANNGIGNIPMGIALDLKKTLSGKSLDSMTRLALSVAGEGTQPAKMSLKVKPQMTVLGQILRYPGYVTVNHEFPAP